MAEKPEKQKQIEELTVPVAGMTCAACVNSIEKALRGLPGVREANVSLAGGKAAVKLDPEACTLPDIERAIEDVGYEVPWSRLQLLVPGMTDGEGEALFPVQGLGPGTGRLRARRRFRRDSSLLHGVENGHLSFDLFHHGRGSASGEA